MTKQFPTQIQLDFSLFSLGSVRFDKLAVQIKCISKRFREYPIVGTKYVLLETLAFQAVSYQVELSPIVQSLSDFRVVIEFIPMQRDVMLSQPILHPFELNSEQQFQILDSFLTIYNRFSFDTINQQFGFVKLQNFVVSPLFTKHHDLFSDVFAQFLLQIEDESAIYYQVSYFRDQNCTVFLAADRILSVKVYALLPAGLQLLLTQFTVGVEDCDYDSAHFEFAGLAIKDKLAKFIMATNYFQSANRQFLNGFRGKITFTEQLLQYLNEAVTHEAFVKQEVAITEQISNFFVQTRQKESKFDSTLSISVAFDYQYIPQFNFQNYDPYLQFVRNRHIEDESLFKYQMFIFLQAHLRQNSNFFLVTTFASQPTNLNIQLLHVNDQLKPIQPEKKKFNFSDPAHFRPVKNMAQKTKTNSLESLNDPELYPFRYFSTIVFPSYNQTSLRAIFHEMRDFLVLQFRGMFNFQVVELKQIFKALTGAPEVQMELFIDNQPITVVITTSFGFDQETNLNTHINIVQPQKLHPDAIIQRQEFAVLEQALARNRDTINMLLFNYEPEVQIYDRVNKLLLDEFFVDEDGKRILEEIFHQMLKSHSSALLMTQIMYQRNSKALIDKLLDVGDYVLNNQCVSAMNAEVIQEQKNRIRVLQQQIEGLTSQLTEVI